jgi:hypothetical protein
MDWLSTLLTNETLLQLIGAYFILQQAATVGPTNEVHLGSESKELL